MENYIPEMFNVDELGNIINANRDTECKEIGDRVNILDYSSCTHMNGKELDSEADEEMQFNNLTYFIVAYDRQKHEYDAFYVNYNQDLIIANPITNKLFRINSGHVQLR